MPAVVTVQEAPAHAPPHWTNCEPVAADSDNITGVFAANDAEQTPGQLIPDGLLVTVPVPLPCIVTWI
jgi:hypothetical protein